MLSVIFVTVRSRLTGRKFFTPDMRFSKLAETPDVIPESARRDVRRDDIEEKLRKRSDDGAA